MGKSLPPAKRRQESETASYWYRLAVVAPYPVTFVAEHALQDAVGGEFVVERPGGVLRVLVVDGPSFYQCRVVQRLAGHLAYAPTVARHRSCLRA